MELQAHRPHGPLAGMALAMMADSHRPFYELALGALPVVKRGATFLEIGHGLSPIAEHLLANGYRYVGVDHSQSATDICRERAPAGQFICGDVADVGLPRADVALMVNVLQWLPAPVAAMIRVRRALRRGGRMIIGTPDMERSLLPVGSGLHYSAAGLLSLFMRAGFVGVSVASHETPHIRYLVGSGAA
jgi:SAM-dependent methyltransferase